MLQTGNTNTIDLFVRAIKEGPLSEMFHVKCIYHTFNLITQDNLKLISPLLETIQIVM